MKLFLAMFFLLHFQSSYGVSMTWFPSEQFVRLEVTQNPTLDTQKISARFDTEDAASIASLITRISALPAQGDRMKSLSPNNVKTTLQFFTAGKKEMTQIEIYGGHFKTPSTGFNVEYSDMEKNLNADIESILRPALKNKLLKIPGLTLEIPEGSIRFLGSEFKKNDGPGMPTIGPTNEDRFEVTDKKGLVQMVSIHSGQLPPQPKVVLISGKNYTINTFKSSRNENLYGPYFEVSN